MASNSDIVFPEAARRAQAERGSAQRLRQEGRGRISRPGDAGPCRLHRRARHRVPRDRVGGRRALHPASRRTEGLHQGDRRADARLRRLRRQPAVHHHQQPGRQRPGVPVPARLRQPPAHQGLGPRPRGRGRRRRCWSAWSIRAIAPGPSARSCSRSRPGTSTARSTSPSASRRPRWRWRWTGCASASPRSKRRTRGCARRAVRRRP